jgi:hypothetical protein
MLKQLLLALTLLTTAAYAQEPVKLEKTVVCADAQQVLDNLNKKYSEVPLWGGHLSQSNVAVFVNAETKTWTIVQWNETLACVIDSGTGYVLNWPGKGA